MAVLRVDPLTGARRVLSDPGNRGPTLLGPEGVAVEATGSLLVTDPLLNAVFRVDRDTGDRVIISK